MAAARLDAIDCRRSQFDPSGLSAAAPSESRLGEAVMDAEVANCSASKHGPGQSVKFLAAREHIDNQLYALDLCL